MTGSSESNLNSGEPDPFVHLHKMSTTAGLGSGDYVAINGIAVGAMLAGAASAFVLFNSPVLLIIPLIGLFLSILAWWQISESNGTQTGREVAAIGLLLSLGFGGFGGIKTVYLLAKNHVDETSIVSQVKKLGDLVGGDSVRAKAKLEDARAAAGKRMGIDYNAVKLDALTRKAKYLQGRAARATNLTALVAESQAADQKYSDLAAKLETDPDVVAAEHAVDAAGPHYPEAYALFDEQFRKHTSLSEFESNWRKMSASPLLGDVQGIDWNHLLSFEVDPLDQTQVASGMMLLKCNPPEPLRVHMSFRKEKGVWLVDQLQEVFPSTEPQAPKKPVNNFIGPPKPQM